MQAKQEYYEKEMQPLIEQLINLAEKGGINFVSVAHL